MRLKHFPQLSFPCFYNLGSLCLIACFHILLTSTVNASQTQVILPKHRLFAHELAVIINKNDELSIKIGEYYAKARDIPEENILRVRFKAGKNIISSKEFSSLRKAISNLTPANVQAYAITWTTPYRVDCMSITSALTFGFDRSWCSEKQCASTRNSPLFSYRGVQPYNDLGARPTMSIAAENFRSAKQLIDRGISADHTQPKGTAYLVSTSDKARNVRSVIYNRIAASMQGWINTKIIKSDAIKDRDDVMFYFTGKKHVKHLDTLAFLPGAVADHLTSAGGRLTGSKQMNALRWLEAGASGSYGTVIEPCNLLGKFPNPGILMDSYGSGKTLIEAYWQSVQQPGEGIFIGEPLAAPFDGSFYKVENDHILLNTRTLSPGQYELKHSINPIGPYKTAPELITVIYHQQFVHLPNLGNGYYRLSIAKTM